MDQLAALAVALIRSAPRITTSIAKGTLPSSTAAWMTDVVSGSTALVSAPASSSRVAAWGTLLFSAKNSGVKPFSIRH